MTAFGIFSRMPFSRLFLELEFLTISNESIGSEEVSRILSILETNAYNKCKLKK